MGHRFSVKQIAAQAGVSPATVDRVRHARGRVHERTCQRVAAAIDELEEQARAGVPAGLGLAFDIVLNSPERFSSAVRQAFVTAAAQWAPLRIAPRFQTFERAEPETIAAYLASRDGRYCHGVVLKAPAHPSVTEAIARLTEHGIPVVTIATDISASRRCAYVGIDNRAAGQTAAFLLSRFIDTQPGVVLANLGSRDFHGEHDRWRGFVDFISQRCPERVIATVDGGYGLDQTTYERARAECARHAPICGVYSIGGGNRGLLRAMDETGDSNPVVVGHDLDAENRRLLRAGRIDAVVDHDLEADARRAIQHLLAQRRGGQTASRAPSRAVIVTPWNL